MIVHMVLMALLVILSIFSAVKLFGIIDQTPEAQKLPMLLYAIFNIVNVIALCFGIVYLLNGYTKKAAGYYKTFLLLIVVANIIGIAVMLLSDNSVNKVLSLSVLVVKTIALLVLVFVKDLGKRNTWIVFCILLFVDLLGGFSYLGDAVVAQRLIATLSRLTMDGSIGLAIRGKYKDKDARGTT